MATDATGAPSSLGIPTLNLSADRPTGLAINEIVASVDSLIVAHSASLPAGIIVPYGGASAPAGWKLCDGTAYSTTTEATLFAAISSTYGTGGAGTFRVPDFRGRTVVGSGAGSGLTSRSLGQTGGEEGHVLSQTETPPHTHSTLNGVLGGFGQAVLSPPASGGGPVTFWAVPSGQGALDMQTSSIGSGNAHNNMQPFGVANWIIKA